MNLTPQTALHGVAQALRERIAPAVEGGFARETARLAELFLTLNANWIDDAVAVRVAENAAIRSLFAQVGKVDNDIEFAEELVEAANSRDPGLRISELDIENDRLRALLLKLHVRADVSAKELSQRIWHLLEQCESARAPRS